MIRKQQIFFLSLLTLSLFAKKSNEPFIKNLYSSTSGFSIDQSERKLIEQKGGNPTYGEITYEGLQTLLDDLQLTRKDVFYDLGCGVGKVCVQVALNTPAKAIGIELSPTRAKRAQNISIDLKKKKIIKQHALDFIEGNITDATLHDATVIFMCSTCFSHELMQKLTDKLARLKKGLRVITLKELAPNASFKMIKTYSLPMTWSTNTLVYLYKLVK